MFLKPPDLVPAQLQGSRAVGGQRREWVRAWSKKRFPKNGESETSGESGDKPKRIFNWTDTRGDRFAVCFAKDEYEARRLVLRHAFVHLAELDRAERESQGRTLPKSKMARQEYEKRLRGRASKFASECVLRELTYQEFLTLADEQKRGQ